MEFDGGDWIDCGKSFLNKGNWTIIIRVAANSTQGGFMGQYSSRAIGRYVLCIERGEFKRFISSNRGNGYLAIGEVQQNKWSEIAISKAEDTTMYSYNNGGVVDSIKSFDQVPLQVNMKIGGVNGFKGAVDEVMIWDRALSPDELKLACN